MLKRVIDFYNKLFHTPNNLLNSETFHDELNYECDKLSFMFILASFAWLTYIPLDLRLHNYPILAVSLRLGLTLFSIFLVSLKVTKFFKPRPGVLLMALVVYLHLATSIITATADARVIHPYGKRYARTIL